MNKYRIVVLHGERPNRYLRIVLATFVINAPGLMDASDNPWISTLIATAATFVLLYLTRHGHKAEI